MLQSIREIIQAALEDLEDLEAQPKAGAAKLYQTVAESLQLASQLTWLAGKRAGVFDKEKN